MNTLKLRNGMELPQIGLGTWQLTDRELLKQLISKAWEKGYRLIDTAAAYSNEIAISKAVAEAEIPRSDLIVSDKVWNTSRGYDAVQEACRKSLKKLKMDYLDMYLIHWPASMRLYSDWEDINSETWRGMEALLKEGLVRTIGVCNFKVHHLEALKKTAGTMPFINQIEYHPGMIQKGIYSYCMQNDIQIEASSPLGNGQILGSRILKEVAEKHGKTTAQVCLRWGIQKKLIVIPRTSKVERLSANLDVFDFSLADEDMSIIDSMSYCGGIGIDSDEVEQFG